ncbi:iron-sulfur cluster repair di-iron protein, ric [Streptococcus uberis]|uniref:iron-sulfur cluster repair di-iron protein, ric n=1 Tax=Streptococcus uberis TaxID=1349 RepID=UPI0022B92DEB|nr:iron-sulfur cluster repair di-iron protein, ric [Streptococcus uberis]MCZ8466532.1 iron-sulfur cluster repair di-iron protein, ric [Streptococcus uberis]
MTAEVLLRQNEDKLELYTKAITKAHGKNHPEVFEVSRLYETIKAKVDKGDDFTAEIAQLKDITNDFAIPDDVCATFEETYKLLKKVSLQASH